MWVDVDVEKAFIYPLKSFVAQPDTGCFVAVAEIPPIALKIGSRESRR